MSRIVDDAKLQDALDWLRDSAETIGALKKQATLTAAYVRHVKAIEMKKVSHLPVSAQERDACASTAYLEAIYKEAEAAGEYEKARAEREARSATIECWRSEQANYRAML